MGAPKVKPAGKLYKLLRNGKSRDGQYKWSLPKKKGTAWVPGEWHEVTGELVQCHNGLHLTSVPSAYLGFTNPERPEVYEAETEGEVTDGRTDEIAARKVRLVRRLPHSELAALGVVDAMVAPPAGTLFVIVSENDARKLELPTRKDGRWRPSKVQKATANLRLWTRNDLKDHGQMSEGSEVYKVEIDGKVRVPRGSGPRASRYAMSLRLLAPMPWAEKRKLGLVQGPKIRTAGDSTVLSLVRFTLANGRGLSDRQAGYAVLRAVKSAVVARIPFLRRDFAALALAVRRRELADPWGASGAEWFYRWLIDEKHESAIVSFEEWRGRKPFVVDGERLRVGSIFRWGKRRGAGGTFKVSSFDDIADQVRTHCYSTRFHKDLFVPDRNRHEVRVGRSVYVFSNEEITAAESQRLLRIKHVKRAEKTVGTLRYLGPQDGIILSQRQVEAWTTEQLKQADAFAKACRARKYNEPFVQAPDFIQAAIEEKKREAQRDAIRGNLRRAKWKAGDRQGQSYEFMIEVTTDEIDAEEQRLLAEAKGQADDALVIVVDETEDE